MIPERRMLMIQIQPFTEQVIKDWEVEDNLLDEEQQVRAFVKGFLSLEWSGENSCIMTCYVHVDPKAPGIPDSVLNFASKRVLYMGQKALLSGEIFDHPDMRQHILKKLDLASRVSEMINVPKPDPTSADCYFNPDYKRKEEEPEQKGWFNW